MTVPTLTVLCVLLVVFGELLPVVGNTTSAPAIAAPVTTPKPTTTPRPTTTTKATTPKPTTPRSKPANSQPISHQPSNLAKAKSSGSTHNSAPKYLWINSFQTMLCIHLVFLILW